MADRRSAETVLEEWRAAERRAEEAAPGSREAIQSRALVDALRHDYQSLVDAALDEQDSEPHLAPSS